MASLLIAALLLISHGTSAWSIDHSKRTNGFCKHLDIPISATAPGNEFVIPRVDNDIEALSWAIYSDTRTTPSPAARVTKNITLSGTYNIHAFLCVPKQSAQPKDILQIASHGVHYDSRYWDPELDREKQSYVEASLKAGYSILTYDRLGVGLSDIPDAYNGVQALLEVEILRQLTLMARDGSLYNFASKAKPDVAAFNSLTKPKKVVHIGHSFGSVLTSAFIARYGNLTDGAIITGYLLTQFLAKAGMASWGVQYAATASPPFKRPSGYVVNSKIGIQNIFFGGDVHTAFTEAQLNYGDSIKQPVPIGEIPSAFPILMQDGSSFKGPVQYFLPEFDFYICAGDCKGIFDPQTQAKVYPNASAIEVAIQPNTGHALTLHNNATAGYQVMFDFLARHSL